MTFRYRHQNLPLLPLEAVPTIHSVVLWSQEYPRRGTKSQIADARSAPLNLLVDASSGQVLPKRNVKDCHIPAYRCIAAHRQNTLLSLCC